MQRNLPGGRFLLTCEINNSRRAVAILARLFFGYGGDKLADNTIDTLDIQVKSSTNRAVKALGDLESKLSGLNKVFGNLNTGGLRNYYREIGKVSTSIKALSGIKVNVTNLSGAGKEFEKLSKKLSGIDTTKIQATSDGIAKISHSMSLLNNVDFKDSKITNVLGSLKRLAEVDMDKFDSNGIASVVSSISNLSDIPDISSGLNRIMSSLQKLVNAGDKTEQVANQLPALGKALKNVVNDMSGAKKVSESVNLFVQSIGRLSSAGNKTGQTAGQLKKLADETLKFFGTMQNAPRISENTIRMTQALAQLASAGGKVGTATSTITKSFNKISHIGNKTLGTIKKISSGIISSFQKIGSSSHHLKTASFNLGTLLKTAVGFGAIRGLWNFGKQSVKLGSDITEVQNVVDVAFGSMAGMVDEFATTSAEKFGLSELAAKQYSGTMMAMLKSSGVAKDAAAEMSTTLAGLAGDIASFYNIDTDLAFQKIRSGISGEIEPLRQLGISMTVANLEAFALSQGITKSYQAMTQAEQAMLRYNYLMHASADAQGDFARTSMNWANQVRILKLNFQQLAATIGQGLIAAVLPGIQVLNALMGKLIQVAETFRDFVYVLLGKKIEGSQGGIVNDLAGIGDTSTGLENLGTAGGDAASGMDDATDSAQKLKKALSVLDFDELNQLANNATSAGDAISGIGGGTGGLDDIQHPNFSGLSDALDELGKTNPETPINKWAERIRRAFLAHDWKGLGFEIADGLNKGLQKVYDVINWKNVGPKITAFTTAFTQTFNSMVDNVDWDLLGRTIGAGINTIVNMLNQSIEGINWTNFGKKISSGIHGAINEINWINLGNLLGNWFMVSWKILYGIVKDFPYKDLGTSIGKGIKGAIEKIDFQVITDTFVNLFNGIFDFLKNFNAEKPFKGLGKKISLAINNSLDELDASGAGETLSNFVLSILDELVDIAEGTDWEKFGRKIGEFLSSINWKEILSKVSELISKTLSGLFNGVESSGLAGSILSWIVKAILAIKVISPAIKLVSKISAALTGSQSANIMTSAFSKLFSGSLANGSKSLSNLDKSLNTTKSWMSKLGESSMWTAGIFDIFKTQLDNMEIHKHASEYGALQSAIHKLGGQSGLTTKEINKFSGELINAQRAKVPFGDALVYVREELRKSGVSSEKFKSALEKSLDELGVSAPKKSKIIGTAIGEGTTKGISESTEKVRNANKSLIDKIKEWWTGKSGFDIHSPSKYMFSVGENIISGLYNGTNSSKPALLNLFAQIPNQMKNQFLNIGNIFSQKGKEVVYGLKNGYSSNSYVLLSYLGGQPQIMSGKFGGLKPLFVQKGNDMVGGIREGWEKNSSSIYKMFNGVPKSISNSMGSLYGIGRNAITNFRNGFQSVHIPTPNFSVSSTRYSWGSSSFSVPKFNLRWYAKGGLFDMPSVIGVGEAGKEAVLPLENRRTMSMIADSILSNAPSTGMNEDVLTNAVARGFAMAMMNNQQSPVNVTCYAELRTEDNEVLARAVTKGQQSIDYRMNPTPQFGY